MCGYDQETLNKLHITEANMLREFDAICRTHDIKYFVVFGTAIGAVRHQGFIPWDDDIDIGMMREDYEKLCNLPDEMWRNCKEGLYLVRPDDPDPLHRSVYPKIYKKNTVFETEYHYKYSNMRNVEDGCYLPIWMDIFVYDRFDSQQEIAKKVKLAFPLKKFYYYAKCKINVVKSDGMRNKTLCLFKNLIHRILNIFPNPENKIYDFYSKLCKNEGEYVTSLDFDFNYESKKLCCKYDDMFPLKNIRFENIEVLIQKNYNDVLTELYGDYMKLPPVENRVNHPPYLLKFDE